MADMLAPAAVVAMVALACASACGAPHSPSHRAPAASAAPRPETVKPDETPEPASFGHSASFALDKAALRAQGASPRLIEKVDASAYRYFRMLGPAFAARSCLAFRDVRWHLPVAAIHGDPHVEQFVVTATTYGLEDFDQAGYGPAVIDLVRYASSLHLTCREVKWPCKPEDAVTSYLKAYRASLDHPPKRVVPRMVEQVRRKSPQEKEAWLRWTDSLMKPLPPEAELVKRRGWAQFASMLSKARPDHPSSYYDIVRVGAFQMGFGSALETKLLFRIRGETDAATDDLVLEARPTAPPGGNECAWRPTHGGSLHALMFMSLLGPRMPEVYGFITADENPGTPEFWVQAWDPGYRELAIVDLESQADLDEVAVDAARQLAGHFWTQFPEPLRVHQRHSQLLAFDLVEDRARVMARELSDEVVTEWQRFRAAP